MTAYRFSLFWLLLVVIPVAAVTSLGVRTFLLLNGTIRPPRPMFCNEFGRHHDFQIFPEWSPTYYLYDERNIVGWTDYEDNAIVLVLTPPRARWELPSLRPRLHSLRPGLEQSSIELGDDGPVAKITRQKNTLFVVFPDATV